MPEERLIHDVAMATSRHILDLFAGCIREEEQGEAFQEIYDRVKAGIECFEIRGCQHRRRLDPGRN